MMNEKLTKDTQDTAGAAPAEEKGKERFRDNLYAKIPLSVRTMDFIIAGLIVLLVTAIVVGIILGTG